MILRNVFACGGGAVFVLSRRSRYAEAGEITLKLATSQPPKADTSADG